MRYKNQNVAVLGAGLSGIAAALLLKDEGANVTVLDSADENKLLKSTIDTLRAQNIRVNCGEAADKDAGKYDRVVSSPGIDPASRLAQNFSSRKIEIIGELELGGRSANTPVIAITGTNGKTTTTEMLAQMLNDCGQKTIACGNIGKPLSEVAREKTKYDVLTVEEGSLYPALQRLLLKGWVKAEWRKTETNRRARFYTLTTAGRKQLGLEVSQFRQIIGAIGRVLEDAKEAG